MGEVRARGMKRPRVFLEVGALGIAAPLAVAGQGFEKGRWDTVAKYLPGAVEMAPTLFGIRLDGEVQPLLDGQRLERGLDVLDERGEFLIASAARRDNGQTPILFEVLQAQHFAKTMPICGAGRANRDVAVLSAKCLVRRGQQMRRPGRADRFTGGEIDRCVPIGLLQRRFHQRGVDHLPPAGFQLVHIRCGNAGHRQDTGINVGDRVAGLDRRSPGLPGD